MNKIWANRLIAGTQTWDKVPASRKEGDCVLSAHGLILLLGLVLASLGVIALKFSSV